MLYEKGTVLCSGEIAVGKIVRVPAIMEIEYISRYKEMDARIDFLDPNSHSPWFPNCLCSEEVRYASHYHN